MTRTELLEKIANTTAEMRSHQRQYSRTRDGANLTAARKVEKELDELLAAWHANDGRPVATQGELL